MNNNPSMNCNSNNYNTTNNKEDFTHNLNKYYEDLVKNPNFITIKSMGILLQNIMIFYTNFICKKNDKTKIDNA